MTRSFFIRYQFARDLKPCETVLCADCHTDLVRSLDTPCDHDSEEITGQLPRHITHCDSCGEVIQ